MMEKKEKIQIHQFGSFFFTPSLIASVSYNTHNATQPLTIQSQKLW